jgi:hypothetical protein
VEENTSSAILNLASFAQLEQFWAARLDASTEEASMSFEEFESSLGRIAHEIENEIKAHELARYKNPGDGAPHGVAPRRSARRDFCLVVICSDLNPTDRRRG